MNCLTIYKGNYADATIISNRFIDEYMRDANDAQLKIYLYLIRLMSANMSTSVSDIADKFNHTEKDVLRALKYWEKNKLLSLDYNESKTLVGIRLEEPDSDADKKQPVIEAEGVNRNSTMQASSNPVVSFVTPGTSNEKSESKTENKPEMKKESEPEVNSSTFEKPSYSLDQLKAFLEQEEAEQVLFIAEQYLGKTLSTTDMRSVLFIYDHLKFSADLIDYLIQYCVERGKKDFRYIEKVAISWAEANITTPKQAAAVSRKYDKIVYTIMKALGKDAIPTDKEVIFIQKWTNDYCFTNDIILEACDRTVLATDKHRFEYADGILGNWNKNKVHHLNDIKELDSNFNKNKAPLKTSTNKFNQFKQNSYDFDELEKEILSN